MTNEDAKAIANLRTAISGRTRWEGQPERMDERLLRLLDAALADVKAACERACRVDGEEMGRLPTNALDMAVGQPGKK